MAPSRPRLRLLLFATTIAAFSGLGASQSFAQAVERNLPRPEPRPDIPVVPPTPKLQDDATPLGPNLSALITISGTDDVESAPNRPPGVDLHRLERLKGSDQRFAKFLGRPISQKLIAEIDSEILTIYRSQGHPLINISTPPQDISSGVLEIRVLEFSLGEVKTAGSGPVESGYISKRVRLRSGAPVDTNLLTEDLDWINRYPFRQVTVAFTPAQLPGSTDLALQAQSTPPWRVSAGYANSGSPQSGLDRFFVSAEAGIPGLHDAVASYQGTGSRDAVFENGRPFNAAHDPLYRSNGLDVIVPTLPRQAFEVTLNTIQTNQPFEAFVANSAILEATLAYRSALSNLRISAPGELAFGLETRRSTSRIKFDGVAINSARFDVYQLFLGYAWRGNSPVGATQFTAAVHTSPGGITAHNTDRAFADYSVGRFSNARYAYATIGLNILSQPFSIFGSDGVQIYDGLTAQYGDKAMPSTEQMGLGGSSAVRGYTLDDGAFDAGAILKTELRRGSSGIVRRNDALSSSLFIDIGYGRANFTGDEHAATSIGAAMNYRLAQRVNVSLDFAVPMNNFGNTRSGQARVETLLAVTF